MIALRTGYRAVSNLFSHASPALSSIHPGQSLAFIGSKTVAEPHRSIFTFARSLCVSLQPLSSFLQSSAVLQESRRNQGCSRIYHPYRPHTRTQLLYGPKKGKPRTERVVLHKFFRLRWGMWIRTIAGRHKRLFGKSRENKIRSTRHVMCNAQQCRLLDQMTHEYWKKPKYYVDDPYEPYHSREEFPYTRMKPVPWP
ncbi:unnamed protein product [Bemisia tabaci]|uniref:Large ribosomal subunit protein bL35m n=1 Tax=Bemisia tabaci TaxID=7038 RepID=A0A9P0ABD5_BEMTA|nr:unnamed protein product [Bemisia tabaci]